MPRGDHLDSRPLRNALPGIPEISDDAALILGAIPGGVYGLDLEARATLVNEGASRILGWSAPDLLGRRLHDIIHHTREDGTAYPIQDCPVYRTITDGHTRRSEADVFWRKDGTRVAVELDCQPIVRSGVRTGVLVTFRDISDRLRSEERSRALVREQFARAQAESRLAHLRDALAQAPALFLVTRGPHHLIEAANEQYVAATGKTDLVGRTMAEAFPEVPRERLEILDRAYHSGEPLGALESASALFGNEPDEHLYNFIVQPLRDEGGTVYGLITHAVEVSEQVRSRRALVAQNRLWQLMAATGFMLTGDGTLRDTLQACAQAVVDHMGAAFARIWTLDPASQTLHLQASAGLYTHLDGPHGRVPLGRFKIGLIAQERRPHLTNQVTSDPDIDTEWARREGMVAFAGYPLTVGSDVVGVLGIFARHALTDHDLQALGAVASGLSIGIQRKRNEEALRANEQHLRRRADELTRLTTALERSNRELDAFAYAASHDLRAPLRGTANLAQWIEEDLQGQLSDQTRQMLALMRGRTQRMEALIEGLLAYSRAGRVRHEPVQVDIGTLAREVVDLLSPPESVEILIADDLPVVRTEHLPLQQVLLNLIGNAVKHARREDARVVVSARDEGEFVEIAVKDNGPGIDPQFHARIWLIFQTLEARDKVEGTGIGLALVKKLVESQGGRVWLESSPGAGATFRFLWPRTPAAGPAGAAGH